MRTCFFVEYMHFLMERHAAKRVLHALLQGCVGVEVDRRIGLCCGIECGCRSDDLYQYAFHIV